MHQPFGVLAGINGSHPEGKETGKDAGDCRMWARAFTRFDEPWRSVGTGNRSRRWWWRLHTLHSIGQTILAVDDTAHVAGAIGAQRFPASAAVVRHRHAGMVGAVHESLL